VKLLEVFGGLANVFSLFALESLSLSSWFTTLLVSKCKFEFEELLNAQPDVELTILSSGDW
jgi:hypothetical protein